MTLHLGAIADDYTGATDLALTWTAGGMRVRQIFGVPDTPDALAGADAAVVALKSRTAPVSEAVAQSLKALGAVQAAGARQIFFKYCSTFDSTDDGNIGPVADALSDSLGGGPVIVCPAFPANKRTVRGGHLFVGDQLLSASPMKDHPLTPMRESDLVTLMARQSRHKVARVDLDVVRQGPCALKRALSDCDARFVVVDATRDLDLMIIGAAAADHRLVTGGSGVAMGLPWNVGFASGDTPPGLPRISGPSAVIAGSCSSATRAQLAVIEGTWPVFRMDVAALGRGDDEVSRALAWVDADGMDAPLVIASSAAPEAQVPGQGARIEAALGEIAKGLIARGVTRLVVAGGETSGAVVEALGIKAVDMMGEIAPGVPWTQTVGQKPIALALKSGNFGGEDFFLRAFDLLDETARHA